MSKIRVIFAEYEGSESGVLEILRAFVPGGASAPKEIAAVPDPPAAPVLLEAPKRKASAKPARPAKRAKAEAAASEAPQFAPGGAADLVRACLEKKPMASGDLIKATKATPPAVYTALTAMRRANLIETRVDDADGMRKNFWIG